MFRRGQLEAFDGTAHCFGEGGAHFIAVNGIRNGIPKVPVSGFVGSDKGYVPWLEYNFLLFTSLGVWGVRGITFLLSKVEVFPLMTFSVSVYGFPPLDLAEIACEAPFV